MIHEVMWVVLWLFHFDADHGSTSENQTPNFLFIHAVVRTGNGSSRLGINAHLLLHIVIWWVVAVGGRPENFSLAGSNFLPFWLLWHLIGLIEIEVREEDHGSGAGFGEFPVDGGGVGMLLFLVLIRLLEIGAGTGTRRRFSEQFWQLRLHLNRPHLHFMASEMLVSMRLLALGTNCEGLGL